MKSYSKIKIILLTLFLSNTAVLIQSCGCVCTEKGCISDNIPPFRFIFSEQFPSNQLEYFALIRTNTSFSIIDTVALKTIGPITDRKIYLTETIRRHPQQFEFKEYNYILYNRMLNHYDTLSNISYQSEIKTEVCNECKGLINCQDQLFEYTHYLSPQLFLNNSVLNSFDIEIKRK
jgi:hypothetical protein